MTGLTDYLHARGLLTPPKVTALTGGVSGETLLVETLPERLVVKRALGRLLVAGAWDAKPERAMTEAAAIELLHGLTPDRTPELRGADPERNTIVMTAAPADWLPWKTVLMGKAPDPTAGTAPTAAALGTVLGIWHDRTWHDPAVASRFDDYEALDQLRITPFHTAVAAAHPAVATVVEELADELRSRRDCLVHGDFSPKNVLVGPDGLMVLDFEVAHMGAAVFDVAFLQCHLVLKALHVADRAAEFAEAAAGFLDAYRAVGAATGRGPVERLGWHTACLLLARVDGVSPAGYLHPPTAGLVRRIALDFLAADDPSVEQLWHTTMEAAA
ncbi:aminoglycoside phosphotransferase family protein [Streptomyces sp. NBC_00873]|uniref:phosphotransferase family protein n=1 Tax=unclassified Streptomyces TaxID=2593676 RepID=UPI0038641723|nr:aminoglycoside phosphotransferase family protein [Streptomyces sp. NBC_00873]WTA47834.1 aminoglycoside phosphotransferase family protein [Streptomyces sp. NBC_00842]